MNTNSIIASDYRSRKTENCVIDGGKPTAFAVAFPLAVTALLLILYLFSSLDFSSAGDANIAELLADGSRVLPGYINLTWPLVWILHPLVRVFPGVCWWTCFSIAVMFGSLLAILLSIQKMIPGWRGGILSVLIAGFLWADIYSGQMNYTINTALSATSGFLLLCGISPKDSRGRKIAAVFLSVLFLGVAGSLRWLELLLCLPFFLLALAFRAISASGIKISWNRRKQCSKEQSQSIQSHQFYNVEFLHEKKSSGRALVRLTLAAAAVVILMTAGTWGAGKLTQKIDPWYAENIAGHEIHSSIADYSDCYPSYEDNEEAYQAAGIKPSWLSMVMNFYNSDLNYLNSSYMSRMLPFRERSGMTVSEYWHLLSLYPAVWLSIALILIVSFRMFGLHASLLPFLGEAAGFLAAGMFFILHGRAAWRVTGGMLLAALAGFLVSAAVRTSSESVRIHSVTETKGRKLCIASFLALLIAVSSSITFSVPQAGITDPAIASDYDYMAGHPENCYFVDNRYYMAYNIWTGYDQSKFKNIIPDISDFIIGFRRQLAERGITDIVSDMLVRSDILMNYNDIWYGYLKDYYDPDVTISIMGKNEETGTAYIAYHRPVDMSDVSQAESTDEVSYPVMCLEAEPFSEQQYNVLNVSGGIMEETTGKYTDFALEVQDDGTGNTYTYPMTVSDGSLSVRAVWPDETWDYSSSRILILGKESGKDTWTVLSDLTGQPISFESSQGSEGS